MLIVKQKSLTNYFKGGGIYLASMSIGGVDPIKLSVGILQLLVSKGLITQEDGQKVIDNAKR